MPKGNSHGFFTGQCRDCGKSQQMSPMEINHSRHIRCVGCGGVIDPSKEHINAVAKAQEYVNRKTFQLGQNLIGVEN